MKVDQNKPETWMVLGLLLAFVGVLLRAADPEVGVGWFAIVAGGVLFVVGLLIFAVRTGSGRGGGDDGVG